MSESKHTEGPWRIDPVYPQDIEAHGGVQIAAALGEANVGRDWKIIGPCPPDDEAEANARLIAAAPCLLEALRRVLVYGRGEFAWDLEAEADDMLALADAAILKATGGEA